MTSIETLKSRILSVIQNDNFSIQDLEKVLDPIGSYFTDPSFFNNVMDVVNIITKDRNGDNQFNMDDLTMLGNDMTAIMSLVGAILLLLSAIPTVKLQYNKDATEELIFKVLAYIFLAIVPKQIGKPLTIEEKTNILNITFSVYQIAKSSQILNNLIDKITAWFKSKGMCKCTTSPDQVDAVVSRHLPSFKLDLTHAVNNIREKSEMQREIKFLHQKVNEQSRSIKKAESKKEKKSTTEKKN